MAHRPEEDQRPGWDESYFIARRFSRRRVVRRAVAWRTGRPRPQAARLVGSCSSPTTPPTSSMWGEAATPVRVAARRLLAPRTTSRARPRRAGVGSPSTTSYQPRSPGRLDHARPERMAKNWPARPRRAARSSLNPQPRSQSAGELTGRARGHDAPAGEHDDPVGQKSPLRSARGSSRRRRCRPDARLQIFARTPAGLPNHLAVGSSSSM